MPPVDPAGAADVEAAAAGSQQHGGVGRGVGLVGLVARENPQLVAVVLVGPVALLAGLARRAQGVERGADRVGRRC